MKFLLQVLNNDESESGTVPAVLALGLAKLVLAGIIRDDEDGGPAGKDEEEGLLTRVMTSLVWAYVNPNTEDNQELRQCLAYFFPVYCYSASANQKKMRSVSVASLFLCPGRRELNVVYRSL